VIRLLLLRHGRTTWNAARRMQGQADAPLDETGHQQAATAAQRLARYAPDLLVSSDLQRATSTAAAIAEVTGLPVQIDPRLRERAFGAWQGHTLAEVEATWPAAYARWRAGAAVDEAGVESLDDLAKRAASALRDIAERAVDGQTAVVVGHGGGIRHGLASLLDWPAQVLRTLAAPDNCQWSELRYTAARGWQLRSYNVE